MSEASTILVNDSSPIVLVSETQMTNFHTSASPSPSKRLRSQSPSLFHSQESPLEDVCRDLFDGIVSVLEIKCQGMEHACEEGVIAVIEFVLKGFRTLCPLDDISPQEVFTILATQDRIFKLGLYSHHIRMSARIDGSQNEGWAMVLIPFHGGCYY